jgi:hypothetical protein
MSGVRSPHTAFFQLFSLRIRKDQMNRLSTSFYKLHCSQWPSVITDGLFTKPTRFALERGVLRSLFSFGLHISNGNNGATKNTGM